MQATDNSTGTPTPSGISRRTVVKGAAWAVPAIAVAGAVPAMAASVPCLQFSIAGSACKWPGATQNKAYFIVLRICNTCPQSQTFTITSLENGSGKVMVPCGPTPFPHEVTVPAAVAGGAASCTEVTLGAFSTDSSSNYIDVWGYVGPIQSTPPVSVELSAKNSITAPPNEDQCATANPCIGVTTTTTTAAAATTTTTTTTAPVTTTTTTAPVTTTTTTAAPVAL